MTGAVFGEVEVSLFVAGAVFGEVEVSLFVAGAVLGEVQVLPGSSKKTTGLTYTVLWSCSRPRAPQLNVLGTAGVHDGLQKKQPF